MGGSYSEPNWSPQARQTRLEIERLERETRRELEQLEREVEQMEREAEQAIEPESEPPPQPRRQSKRKPKKPKEPPKTVYDQINEGGAVPEEDSPTKSKEAAIDEELANRIIKMWEDRPTKPEPHVLDAANALFAWHNTVIHPMLVTNPKAGQLLHAVTSEMLIQLDPDYYLSELGPGRRGYVPGGPIPDDVEYELAKRLIAWVEKKRGW